MLTALAGLSIEELDGFLRRESGLELPSFRVRQIFRWLRRGAASFDAMSDLPLDLRSELERRGTCRSTKISAVFKEAGALKAQIELQDKNTIEAVLLSDIKGRKTACLSTQAGCAVRCVFCKTGSLGFSRNLNAAEIVEQFYHLETLISEEPVPKLGAGSHFKTETLPSENAKISNIVFMGMGEPLLNLSETRRAILVLSEGFSVRRITISSCGISSGIVSLAREGPAARLAVSICTARQELRDSLMPLCKAYPLKDLKEALKIHQRAIGQRITLEAVMLQNINTSEADARAMIDFSSGLDVMINLIPWNKTSALEYSAPLKPPTPTSIMRFKKMLEKGGLKVSARRSKGGSIAGACGQLGSVRQI